MNDPDSAVVSDLITRVADGDRGAFAQLYDLTVTDVLAITTSVLRNRSLAQEVTQEVYLEVWRHARRFDPDRDTGNLIRQIARRRAIDRLRTSQADRDHDHEDASCHRDVPGEDVMDSADIRLTFAPVADAIRQLPKIHRDALFLAYSRGLSHSEIAAELRIPLGTVRTCLRDSLRRLRAQLDDHTTAA